MGKDKHACTVPPNKSHRVLDAHTLIEKNYSADTASLDAVHSRATWFTTAAAKDPLAGRYRG